MNEISRKPARTVAELEFYSALREPSYRWLMTCAIALSAFGGSRRLCLFVIWHFVPQTERGVSARIAGRLEGAGGPVGFEPLAEKRGVLLTACSSASGLATAVDSTTLVSSSRRPAPVRRLSLPWAPYCLPI